MARRGDVVENQLRPALHLEDLIEAGFALAGDLKADRKKVLKRLPHLIMLVDEAKHEFYLTAVPRPARGAFSALLGMLAYVVGRLRYGRRPPL